MGERPMHEEALRKTRVIERKHDALKRLQNETGCNTQYAVYASDPKRDQSDESLHKLHNAIHKDLKYREKVLRDHNLYMGPMAAFNDLYPTKQDQVNFKTTKHH